MGTGTLALPYAACRGGLLFNIVGLGLVAIWNIICVRLLLSCLELVNEEEETTTKCMDNTLTPKSHSSYNSDEGDGIERNYPPNMGVIVIEAGDLKAMDGHRRCRPGPPPGTATYGRIAYSVFGLKGLHLIDLLIVLLLLGVVVAYMDAVVSFLSPTFLTTGVPALDTLLVAIIITHLSCVSDVGRLAGLSESGLVAILLSFAVIFAYGLREMGPTAGFNSLTDADLWPKDLEGLSSWFGVVAFGFGIVPIAYNVQEGMADPSKMSRATEWALGLVFLSYVLIGNGAAVLYRPLTGPGGFEGDVLMALPSTGWLPALVRFAMSFVGLATAPLLVVPCAMIVEGKLGIGLRNDGNSKSDGENEKMSSSQLAVRLGVCVMGVVISVMVPAFVNVISFVGTFCVAIVSFIFPPLLHTVLMWRNMMFSETGKRPTAACNGRGKWIAILVGDILLLLWGVIAATIASTITFQELIG